MDAASPRVLRPEALTLRFELALFFLVMTLRVMGLFWAVVAVFLVFGLTWKQVSNSRASEHFF